jgi:hypothetical protein
MKYSIYLTEDDKKHLEFEVVSRELRVHLTRLIERDSSFSKNELINQNWLVNRSRNLVARELYVLEADQDGCYEVCEYGWHIGEFALALRRLDTPRLIELLCDIIIRGWLSAGELNKLLKREGASFCFSYDGEDVKVEVLSLSQLEEDAPLPQEHPNIRLLVTRMSSSLEDKDYSAVLHASASIFETLAKQVVGIPNVQNETLGAFFARYQKDTKLPIELQNKILAVYKQRNTEPLAGHGSLQSPNVTFDEAVTLSELTKAYIKIEYLLQAGYAQIGD